RRRPCTRSRRRATRGRCDWENRHERPTGMEPAGRVRGADDSAGRHARHAVARIAPATATRVAAAPPQARRPAPPPHRRRGAGMNRERINANPAPWAWPDLRGWNLYFLSKLALAWMGALNLHVLPNLLLLAALLLPLPWRWARIART